MKLTEGKLRSIIREELLKEAVAPYSWEASRKSGTSKKFDFSTEEHDYTATYLVVGNHLHVSLEINDIDHKFGNPPKTGEGKQYRIGQTMAEIARYVWKTREDFSFEIEGFALSQSSRKAKLFMRFLEKEFQNAEIYKDTTKDGSKVVKIEPVE